MGVRFPSVFSNSIVNPAISTTAETVIATTPPFSPPIDAAQVIIHVVCSITIGTAGATLTLTIRRGPLVTSPLVQVHQPGITVVAGNTLGFGAFYVDTPGAVGGQQYSLTATVGSATGNSTVLDAAILAMAL